MHWDARIYERRIEAKGVVTLDTHNNLTVLIYETKPLVEKWNIKITEEDEEVFRKYFHVTDIEDALDKTIAIHIVGRKDAKFALALNLHSPLEIQFQGRKVPSTLNVIFLGDMTTGKSEIVHSPKLDFDIGQAIGCEMSKTTGLMGTVDLENRTIIWGIIPLSDKEHVGLDGLQRISPEDLSMMREALRRKVVEVVKAVTGSAPCRTRITATANPNKPIDGYPYRCEAIRDCWPFRDTIDITRWDLFIPFSQKDVPRDEIANAVKTPPLIPKEVFTKHVFWAWNLKAEDIVFTKEAEEEIKKAYLNFTQYVLPELPLINDEYKLVIAKLASAYAILTHNTVKQSLTVQQIKQGEGNIGKTVELFNSVKVVVDKEHVAKVVTFLENILNKWEYFEYYDYVQGIKKLREEEVEKIEKLFEEDETVRRIFEEIAKRQGIEAGVIAEKLGLTKTWISKEVAKLKDIGLVESQERRRGYWLTPKGVAYVRYLREKQSS